MLFGGWDGKTLLGDTWEWDGQNWTKRSPRQAPSARAAHALAYDSARRRVVLFGGLHGSPSQPRPLGDTWEWDGVDWVQRLPSTKPLPVYAFGLAYDSSRARTVQFGGTLSPVQASSDTWAWDGTSWAKRSPVKRPAARWRHPLAYDSRRRKVLLFGGYFGRFYDDTWEWDGTSWFERLSSSRPRARESHDIAYDSGRGVVVLFGGDKSRLSDTWEWDGVKWVQRTPLRKPSGRMEGRLASYGARGVVLLFGGSGPGEVALADTWEYGPLGPRAKYTLIGEGCKASSGVVPALRNRSLPILGRQLWIDLKSAPPITLASLFFGFTPTRFDLGQLGAPGCTAYANPHIVVGPLLTDFNGEWYSPPFSVPNWPSLAGREFHNQFFVVDLKANRLGIVVTSAGTGLVGY
ncbi:MAG: kelch repeat-containing protein [Planctomycetota bacterium]